MAVLASVWVGAQNSSDDALALSVRQALRGDDDLRTVEVTVAKGDATLTGRAPTLWTKSRAIKRSLRVEGIGRVVIELAMRVCWPQWDVPNLHVLLPAAPAGTVVGFLTARLVSVDGLRLLVAAVARAYAAQYFWRGLGAAPGRPPRRALGWFRGLLAGFTSFSIHAGGPPLHACLVP